MKNILFTATLLAFFSTAAMANTGHNGDPESVTTVKYSFQDFLQQFPSGNLPYSFSEQDLQHQLDVRSGNASVSEKPNRLAWEYYDFLPELEKIAEENNMPVYPEPVVAFETESSYAVVYNTGRVVAKQYKTYYITLFTKDGTHQDTYCIAGVEPESLTAATLDQELQVTIKKYQVSWEKDIDEAGVKGNSVKGIDLLETEQFDLIKKENTVEAHPIQLATN